MGKGMTTRRIGLPAAKPALREEWLVMWTDNGMVRETTVTCDEGKCLAELRALGIDPVSDTFIKELISRGH
jgi:hypothetical protein